MITDSKSSEVDASSMEQLALLYLASPALPIGAFAYSQGLEKAIELSVVSDRESLERWAEEVISFGLAQLEGPLLLALFEAVQTRNKVAIEELNTKIFACRETHELYEEERYLGQSLGRLLTTQTLIGELDLELPKHCSFLCAFAFAGVSLQMSSASMLLAFFWSWLENQITVSCKTIPLGQTDAQRVLLKLRPLIAGLVGKIEPAGREFAGASLPGQAMLSALHEVQYSRLFRS